MATTQRDRTYRKIYEQHYGPIPREECGRSYEIHHIDNNHKNSDYTNLKAVTIQEHYDIHFAQGDYSACRLIALRMSATPEQLSMLASLANKKRIENGTHHFLGNDVDRMFTYTRRGTTSDSATKENNARVTAGTHNFLDGAVSRKTQYKRVAEGTHPFTVVHTCPYCNKSGKGTTFKRWHFTNCKNYVL